MKFGGINKVIFFGGGKYLAHFALITKTLGLQIRVVTSNRQIREMVSENVNFVDFLEGHQIEIDVVQSINSEVVKKQIRGRTLGVSCGSAWIFDEDFINRFEGRLVNVHGTRLPQNRGGGSYSWRILRNDRLGACLVHLVESGIDEGGIVKYQEYVYPAQCRIPIDFYNYGFERNVPFFEEFIKEVLEETDFEIVPQQETFSTYFPRLNTEIHGFVNWDWNVFEIERFVCAFDDPYKGSATFLDGRKVRLKDCYAWTNDGGFHPFQSGIIYRISKSGVFVAAKQGSVIIRKIMDEKQRDIMSDLRAGDRFFTPREFLENARAYKAIYTPSGLINVSKYPTRDACTK